MADLQLWKKKKHSASVSRLEKGRMNTDSPNSKLLYPGRKVYRPGMETG